MSIYKVGPWAQAQRALTSYAFGFDRAIDVAVGREAQRHARDMSQGIRDQAPGGVPFAELSEITIFLKGSSKALIDKGDLRRSIKARRIFPKVWFAGVHRTERSRHGESLVNLGILHEKGARVEQVVTPRQREFFKFLAAVGLMDTVPAVGSKIVIEIPARPFVEPVFKKYRDDAPRRIMQDVLKIMGLASRL